MGIQGAADVLERHAADFVREEARSGVQRLQPGVLHLVDAAHLLDEQQRVRAHAQRAVAVRPGPLQRGEQTAVFRDVVGGHADRFVELLDERPAGVLDADAEARGPGIAARAAVDVGG